MRVKGCPVTLAFVISIGERIMSIKRQNLNNQIICMVIIIITNQGCTTYGRAHVDCGWRGVLLSLAVIDETENKGVENVDIFMVTRNYHIGRTDENGLYEDSVDVFWGFETTIKTKLGKNHFPDIGSWKGPMVILHKNNCINISFYCPGPYSLQIEDGDNLDVRVYLERNVNGKPFILRRIVFISPSGSCEFFGTSLRRLFQNPIFSDNRDSLL